MLTAMFVSDVSFVNDSFILNESLQGLGSNESSQRVICSFSRGRASGLLHRLVQVNRNDSFISHLGLCLFFSRDLHRLSTGS